MSFIFHTKIVGSTFCGGQNLIPELDRGDPLQLVRDPENEFDTNAVQVRNENGDLLGHLPKDTAAEVAPLMDGGTEVKAKVAEITGGSGNHYGCNVTLSYYPPETAHG